MSSNAAEAIGSEMPGETHTQKLTRKRNAAEKRFRLYGVIAITIAMACLVWLIGSIIYSGASGFTQTSINLDIPLDREKIEAAEKSVVKTSKYKAMIQDALTKELAGKGFDASEADPKKVANIMSKGAAGTLREYVLAHPDQIGETVSLKFLTSSRVDGYMKGRVTRESLADDKYLSPAVLDLVDHLHDADILLRGFNSDFILGADASDNRPEQAGIGVAMLGSFFMMVVVLGLALPIGVSACIYLEEFASQIPVTDLIEVNISNLAAVPSIVFGILGLSVFIQFMHLPQSAPLVGGLVLTLMTLPIIIISTRAALQAVPPSIRDAALGVGASKMQTVFHHVLPLAMPGILTGTIIGLAQALGETAPLLLIGMVGYIASNYPEGFLDGFVSPNSAMPAQIFEWAKRSDPAFYERAWAGIIVLLVFLAIMNITAIILRKKFERRW